VLAAGGARAASLPAVESDSFMVVAEQHFAAEAGADILRAGGNAVDAAVATGYVLAVVDPCCGNIGGGGFMTLHLADGRDRFLDFRETAPAAATAGMFLDSDGKVPPGASISGWRAVAVPGSVLGLDTALTRYGSMGRARVMAAAIALARDGFVLTRADCDILAFRAGQLRADAAAAKVFVRPDGRAWQPGDRLAQPELADTLSAIAAGGADAFYHGRIPRAVAAAAKAGGGILTEADFAGYAVHDTAPLRCAYRGWDLLSAPPPSSGGATLCEILNILEGYDLTAMGLHSAAEAHVLAEAMRHAFLDRDTLLGDPEFVSNPLEKLLSKDYAAAIRASIGAGATPSRELLAGTPPHEKPETTQYSVLDHAGNAVSVTYTLNGAFGAGVMAAGFLLNDEMDDFAVKPGSANMFGLVQGVANAIAAGKRPLSSMAPTIVMRDGHVAMVLGSPGGPRIITIVLETLINLIDHGMAPQEAVNTPRLHMQWLPDKLFAEPYALSPDTASLLRGMGYDITVQAPWGAAELIYVGQSPPPGAAASPGNDAALSGRTRPGWLYGANDARRPAGAAVGR
jgi:gamma-glutamyltranspeptidase/glutathione hydrolase